MEKLAARNRADDLMKAVLQSSMVSMTVIPTDSNGQHLSQFVTALHAGLVSYFEKLPDQ